MKTSELPPPLNPRANWPTGLSIRGITPADAASVATLHNQPGFRYGTMRLPHPTADDVQKRIESKPASNTWLVAEIDDQIVGDTGLFRFSGRRAHAAEFGLGVHDSFVGRGIGQALIGEVLAMADNWLNLHRIELTVFAENARAIRLYERNGFVNEGHHKDYAFRDGRYADVRAMARLKIANA